MAGESLVEALLGDRRVAAPELAEIESELQAALLRARQTWPQIDLPAAGFARFLGRRISADAAVTESLRALAIEDLYLAHGCLLGDAAAARAFFDVFYPEIRSAVARLARSSELADDIAQEIYGKLFAGDEPKIDGYRGEGQLATWLRVVAARAALDQARRDQKQAPLSESVILGRPAGEADQVQELLRRRYAPAFKAAFEEATGALSARERAVLRYSLDGSTAEEIGQVFGVHRVTVARWLGAVRSQLMVGTHTRLRQRLAASADEVNSILRLFDSQLSLSLDRFLPAEGNF